RPAPTAAPLPRPADTSRSGPRPAGRPGGCPGGSPARPRPAWPGSPARGRPRRRAGRAAPGVAPAGPGASRAARSAVTPGPAAHRGPDPGASPPGPADHLSAPTGSRRRSAATSPSAPLVGTGSGDHALGQADQLLGPVAGPAEQLAPPLGGHGLHPEGGPRQGTGDAGDGVGVVAGPDRGFDRLSQGRPLGELPRREGPDPRDGRPGRLEGADHPAVAPERDRGRELGLF